MTLARFFLRTAFNHLRRGEQRVLAALLCITFGVMSLVAMGQVARALDHALVVTPAHLLAADLSLSRQEEDFLSSENVAELEALRQAGQLDRYTLVAHTGTLVFRTPASGELLFADTGLGIDPAVYPLAGDLRVGDPAQSSPAALLQAPGDVLMTRDLAQANHLRVGDALILSDLDIGAPVPGILRGIVDSTPSHQGGRMYYTRATAELLAGHNRVLNVALAMTPAAETLAAQLGAGGWFALPATIWAQSNQETRDMMNLLLKGAGILGLLVGGIGIASTMQVLLRRRQREIAVWKTLGYTAGQLQALFAVEAALLGVAGSLLGAGLGVLVSVGLLELLGRTTNFLLGWSFSPWPVVTGALVGVVTTVIFALWAIVRAAHVPPMALLRSEAAHTQRAGWLPSLGLALPLAVPFAALTSGIMGSVVAGVGVLLFAVAGLVALGGVLGGLAWLAVRLLGLAPASLPLVRLAQSSLRRRGLSLVFAMIALFTGLVALACGVVVTQNGQREMSERTVALAGPEVSVLAPARAEADLLAAAQAADQPPSAVSYETTVQRITLLGEHSSEPLAPTLLGRSEPGDYQIVGAPWGSDPRGVYTYAFSSIEPGTQVEITLLDGTTHTLPVVGTYTPDFNSLHPRLGLLLPAALSRQLAPPDTVQADFDTAPARAAALTEQLGLALPQATVVNQVAYAARFIAAYRNLFLLAVSFSGLALLAGALLVANAVSLAMLDRRYELGVLKAVGYTRRQLLTTLTLEYSLVAVIATAAALAGVQVLLWVLGRLNDLAGSLLVLAPASAALIAVTGIGLILLTVVAATWGPTGVSPAIVLNDRE